MLLHIDYTNIKILYAFTYNLNKNTFLYAFAYN